MKITTERQRSEKATDRLREAALWKVITKNVVTHRAGVIMASKPHIDVSLL